MSTYKKYWLKLRLTQSELDAIAHLGLTITQAAHQAIKHWQSLDEVDRANAIRLRQHLLIDVPAISRSIGANKTTKQWMDSVDNTSLTTSTAIDVWLQNQSINNG